MAVGGNAPVMVQRFVSEGVHQVLLGASMSPELRSQLDSRVQGVTDYVSFISELVAAAVAAIVIVVVA